ncbi:hypothetical protein ACIO53_30080 [Streptomyces sp. NPDC087305]|uniref:hypothetical protein n=1 Tax=Streptomyces sp. NPDC087305 TaxID=3365781 RepID=UPI00380999EA
MVDYGGAGRALSGTYRGARWGRRTIVQRSWFKDLIYRSVLLALMVEHPEVEDQRIREAAERMARVLNGTPLHMEDEGFFARVAQWFRKKITRGIRYPEYRGPSRDTFQARLFRWAYSGASTDRGLEVLDYVHFPGGDDPAKEFAKRFQWATAQVLRDPMGPRSSAHNYVRDEMLRDIEIGLTEAQVERRIHNRNLALKALGGGAAGATLSTIGLHSDWQEAVGITLAGSGAAALMEGMVGSYRTTQNMLAVRRRALSWLFSLAKVLLEWRGSNLPERDAEEDWRDYLLRTLQFLVREDSEGLRLMLAEMNTEEKVAKLVEAAERVHDQDLARVIMEVETTLQYNVQDFPFAVRELLYLASGLSPKVGGYSYPELDPGQGPAQIPRMPGELD